MEDGKEVVRVKPVVRMEEVAAIKLGRIEKRLFETDQAVKLAIKANVAEQSKLSKALGKQVSAEADKAFKAKAKTVVDALKPLFPATTSSISANLETDPDNGKSHISVGIHIKAKLAKGDREGYYNQLGLAETLPVSIEIAKTLKDIEALEDACVKLYTQSAEIKQALSRMSTFERKVKADIAERALASSDEGKLLLDELDLDNFDIPGLDIKLLEAPK